MSDFFPRAAVLTSVDALACSRAPQQPRDPWQGVHIPCGFPSGRCLAWRIGVTLPCGERDTSQPPGEGPPGAQELKKRTF